MPFKKVTLEEWKRKGLPTEISFIYFGNIKFVKKLKNKTDIEKKTLNKK